MGKTAATAAKPETEMPQPVQELPPVLSLSDRDRQIRQFVDSATAGPKRIEKVTHLRRPVKMQVPRECAESYPERYYKWAAIDGLAGEIQESDGMWEVVTRSNHSKVPGHLFDNATGGILYGGQNILVFTWRDNMDAQRKLILADFELKGKSLEKDMDRVYAGADGKPAAYLERVDDPGDGRGATALESDSDYDYGDPD